MNFVIELGLKILPIQAKITRRPTVVDAENGATNGRMGYNAAGPG
jgi:hypothetical protein